MSTGDLFFLVVAWVLAKVSSGPTYPRGQRNFDYACRNRYKTHPPATKLGQRSLVDFDN